ncbi:unnamed protein product [Brassicogethes aeneus]|uniref:tRNA (34-2'-O)-methyltransferase regulator WDR6 n=1 Tax=Brassicogethes aeneus TaxID=1431903 RepID=A0A9P0FFL3_BRAAE|nr:unnamed protein product [Brassicogethes aeneus]
MSVFKNKLIRTDVTYLKIVNDYILTGIGGDLQIFSLSNEMFITKVKIFSGQKIYGVETNKSKNKLLVYGGMYIKVIDFPNVNNSKEHLMSSVKEWILDAKLLDNKLCLATMNNKLLILSSNLDVEKEVLCEERCILYSAFISINKNEIVVMSGTVFSEVLIWWPTKYDNNGISPVLKKLTGHKGVIFSIDYHAETGVICSCSDDRSAILWKLKSDITQELKKSNIDISILTQVHGHSSRIFRCKVFHDFFITGGEDSLVFIWSHSGDLIRKIEAHQGSSIWAIDVDEGTKQIVIGGSNSGLSLFPINSDIENLKLSLPKLEPPNSICFMSNNNIASITENGNLYYYLDKSKSWFLVEKHEELKYYCLMQSSKCKKLFALAGYKGQIFLYKEDSNNLKLICKYITLRESRIYSFHWLTCNTFLICQDNGILLLLFLHKNNINLISTYNLPQSKERWTTSATFFNKELFIVGDRKGHLYVYSISNKEPIQIIKRVHNHLGVTHLSLDKNQLNSLGRNGILRTFNIQNNVVKVAASNKLPFLWLAKILNNLIIGFSGNNFVIWDYKLRSILFEKECGGGHRSWDFIKTSNNCNVAYVKDKIIHCVKIDWNSVCPKELIEGLHVNQINSLVAFNYMNKKYLVSGGEDTTIQINELNNNCTLIKKLHNLKSHLSNVRTIKHVLWKNQKLIFSAGGRAQIILWAIKNENNDCISCNEFCSYYESMNTDDAEMRIMDLYLHIHNEKLYIFAACSNGFIKIFYLDDSNKIILKENVFYKLKCITKIIGFNFDKHSILVTLATDGFLIFWDIKKLLEENVQEKYPVQSIKCHQSGINSVDHKIYKSNNESYVIFLTGGDDNLIALNKLKITNINGLKIDVLCNYTNSGVHCSQITGTKILDNYFFTVSIDQRLCVFEWTSKKLECNFCTLYKTAISDVQGFDFIDNKIVIFGNGVDVIKCMFKSYMCLFKNPNYL